MIEWAKAEEADWIIFDDCDCVPTKALQLDARGILEDTQGRRFDLCFVQNLEKKEIDFAIFRNNKKTILLEVKLTDSSPATSFDLFEKYFPQAHKIQLVKNLKREFESKKGVKIKNALEYLENLDFSSLL